MVAPDKTIIGQTFEDLLVVVIEGQEYIGCKFLRCEVWLPGRTGFKFYDCDFKDCNIVVPGPHEG